MGAPKGNRNSLRHGLRSARMPAGAKHIEHTLSRFRRECEDAILSVCGEVSLRHAALVQSACRHERRAALLEKWLRDQESEMSLQEKLAVLKDVSNATDARDKCLSAAGLDRSAEETMPWLLDAAVAAADDDGDDQDDHQAEGGNGASADDSRPWLDDSGADEKDQ